MSVIYNALKKTQEARTQKNTLASSKVVNVAYKKNSWTKKSIYVSLLLGLTVLMIWNFFQTQKQNKQMHATAAQPTVTKKIAVSTPQLILNGILISGKTKIAMINKQTYSLGDTIHGKKIVNIELNKVQLKNGDRMEELYTIV